MDRDRPRPARRGAALKLVVISHTAHHQSGDVVTGWGPTVREMDALSELFDEVVHVAPLWPGPAPASDLPYASAKVTLRPVAPAGGTRLLAKLGILLRIPRWEWTILGALRGADVVHIRAPAHIAVVAMGMLAVFRRPKHRWVKYAGNWSPEVVDAWSCRLQRWWLRHNLSRTVVTVNGRWPDQPSHIHSFYNPCLTVEEIVRAREASATKRLAPPHRLLFVGALEEGKGVGTALEVVARLFPQTRSILFDVVGDGTQRQRFEQKARDLGLGPVVRFHGWVSRNELGPYYASAHLLLLPTMSEGWPKVVSEAMAYGVVPVVSDVSGIAQVLGEAGCGRVAPIGDVEAFTGLMNAYLADPVLWAHEAAAGRNAAGLFTYERYREAVRKLFASACGLEL